MMAPGLFFAYTADMESPISDKDQARVRLLNPDCWAFEHLVAKPINNTDDFTTADATVVKALDEGNLASLPKQRVMDLYERLRFQGDGATELMQAVDRFLLRRDEQMATLEGVSADVLIEMIGQGFLPQEISEVLGVSYSIIHGYMMSAARGSERVEEALALCSDMQAYKGLQDIKNSSENSKAGVQKAVELARHRMVIAKAINPKRYAERPPLDGAIGMGGEGGAFLVLDVTSNLDASQLRSRQNAAALDGDYTESDNGLGFALTGPTPERINNG